MSFDPAHIIDALQAVTSLANDVRRLLSAAPPGHPGEALVGTCLRAYKERTAAIEVLARAQTKAAEAQRAQAVALERIANTQQRL